MSAPCPCRLFAHLNQLRKPAQLLFAPDPPDRRLVDRRLVHATVSTSASGAAIDPVVFGA